MATSGIRYPADLQVDEDTDYFRIEVRSYARASLTSSSSSQTSISNILLPMPSNIQDTNTVNWGEEKINNITASAINAIQASQNIDLADLPTSFSDAGQRINQAISDSGLGLTEAVGLFKKQLVSEAVNIFGANVSIDQILARQNGQIFNPNLELLFNGVSLRDFKFSFKMTPRDEKERNNVIRIIRTFKKYMAASRGNDKNSKNLYLNTPNVFKLSYQKGSSPHPFLHKFKDCALKGVSVNYTGENVYATYYDGTPISVVMDLNFQELTPIYNEEYSDPTVENVNLGVGF